MLCDPPQRRDAVDDDAPAGERAAADADVTKTSTNVVGGGLGFQLLAKKSSPKVSFFILQRPTASVEQDDDDEIKNSRLTTTTTTHRIVLNPLFTHHKLRNKGKKYPNQFAIRLPAELDRV